MKHASPRQRPYQEVGTMLRTLIAQKQYVAGDRLPSEREIAEMLDVSRTVVRESLIMLEIEGVVNVRRGAGIFVVAVPPNGTDKDYGINRCNNAGPFELLQARQLLESNIAEFAALQVTREDIGKMREALQIQEQDLASNSHENGDMLFHLAVAEATHNGMLVELFKQSWRWRENNPMWLQLHARVEDTHYRKEWLPDHKRVFSALIKRDAKAAKLAMWQHLENVKTRLLELSDMDDMNFDGYLFESWPLPEAANAQDVPPFARSRAGS